MVGPDRSIPSTSAAREDSTPIPRPPNAWILFRADKQRELQMTRGKAPQAEVSKLISKMWREAPEDIRASYERLAERKKAEHKVKYPSYRFQPKKKEEKVQIRQQKKIEKQQRQSIQSVPQANPLPVVPVIHAAPIPPTILPIPMIVPQVAARSSAEVSNLQAGEELYFSPYTPPVSADSSPSPPVVTSVSQRVSSVGSYATQPSPHVHASLDANEWQAMPNQQLLTPVSDTTPLAATGWHDLQNQAELSHSYSQLLAQDSYNNDTVEFEIPETAMPQTLDSLSLSGAQCEATLGDSLVFAFNYQLDNLPLDSALEVSVNQLQDPDGTHEIFGSDFDFSTLDFPYTALDNTHIPAFEMLYSLESIGPSAPNSDPSTFDQYLNFVEPDSSLPDNGSPDVALMITPPETPADHAYVQSNHSTQASVAYIPPSGAANAGQRRAGGSWSSRLLPTDESDSPISSNPPQMFGVPAT